MQGDISAMAEKVSSTVVSTSAEASCKLLSKTKTTVTTAYRCLIFAKGYIYIYIIIKKYKI